MAGASSKQGDVFAISNAAVAAMPADDATFELLTMVPVANIVTLPAFGSTTNKIRHNYVDTLYSEPQKGFTDGAESAVVVGIDPTGDPGQDMLQTASLDGTGKYVVSITRLDGTVSYAYGLISDNEESGGGGEEFNERSHMFTQAAPHVTYTP